MNRQHGDVPEPGGNDNGGAAARRAIVRWAWRMFRREWRQQALVLALLAVVVATAVGFATTAYNLSPVSGLREFGTANHFVRMEGDDPAQLQSAVDAAEERFGTVDVIGHREVAVPGVAEPLDYRTQAPGGAYTSPLLDVRDGNYPASASEVAITDGVADELDLAIGSVLDVDGERRSVVGVVENPSDLDDDFVLLSPSAGWTDSVTIFVDGSDEHVRGFRVTGFDTYEISSRDGIRDDVLAAVSVLLVAVVALALVALVATASFVVIAQRRLRQLGMLGAVGATERQLRLVMVANGTVIGLVGAALGAVLGVGGWLALAPRMEQAAGHRIDAFNVPWWVVGSGAMLAVGAAIAASWWPARAMARVPSVVALSGRPSPPSPVHRSTGLAALLVVGGIVSLRAAGDFADEESVPWTDLLLVCAGTVGIVLGVLLLCPLAIRVVARAAVRLPIAPRLALRDLGRYHARSSAALAAISLALGIPVAIVVTAAAAEATASAGNLSDRQLIVRAADIGGPFAPKPADVEGLQVGVDRVAAALDDPRVHSLDVAADPAIGEGTLEHGRETISLGEPFDDGWRDLTMIYVATSELLDYYDVALDRVDPDSQLLTVEPGELRILGVDLPPGTDRSDPEQITNRTLLTPTYSSLPGTFITPEQLAQRGWERVPAGRWLFETSRPLTDEQRSEVRDIAASHGLAIETRDEQATLMTLRSIATAVGMFLALGILAMTIGLIREETAGDVRTLTATGATSSTRRALTSATAGGLAMLGVVLGTLGAYVALTAGHVRGVGDPGRIPATHLAVLILGTPLAAAAAGWVFAGREPPAIARRPIE